MDELVDIFRRRAPRVRAMGNRGKWNLSGLTFDPAETRKIVQAVAGPIKRSGVGLFVEIAGRGALTSAIVLQTQIGAVPISRHNKVTTIPDRLIAEKLGNEDNVPVALVVDSVRTGYIVKGSIKLLEKYNAKVELIVALIEHASKSDPWAARSQFEDIGIPFVSLVRYQKGYSPGLMSDLQRSRDELLNRGGSPQGRGGDRGPDSPVGQPACG